MNEQTLTDSQLLHKTADILVERGAIAGVFAEKSDGSGRVCAVGAFTLALGYKHPNPFYSKHSTQIDSHPAALKLSQAVVPGSQWNHVATWFNREVREGRTEEAITRIHEVADELAREEGSR